MKLYYSSCLFILYFLFFISRTYTKSLKKSYQNEKPCEKGYTRVGPNCLGKCPPGMKTYGATCIKRHYSRGLGYAIWAKDKCNEKHKQGCEIHGIFYYPKCEENYKNYSCCSCYENCPNHLREMGHRHCMRPLQGVKYE